MRKARERERNRIARFVLAEMERNWDIATADRRPMCADTGLPRYYVRAGLTELAYREWFVPHGAVYLTTVGYGMGAAYGRCITRVVEVHWLEALGIAQALWVLEVERLGPFLVEGDREGRSLFALANREINLRLEEVYRGLPPYAMGRFGETTSRTDEIV